MCLGGPLAPRAALNPIVAAAACVSPTDVHSGTLGKASRFETEPDGTLARLDELEAQTPFVFGRQDPHVPFAGREAIRGRLEAVGAPYEWHEVDAAHAFLRDEGPRYDPQLFGQAVGWMLALFCAGAVAGGRRRRSDPAPADPRTTCRFRRTARVRNRRVPRAFPWP